MTLIRRILGSCNNADFRRYFLGCILSLFFITSFAQTGPGGVGTSDGTSTLSVWYRPDNGISASGTSVDSWANSAGIPALNITENGTNRPTLVTGAVNGYSEISFNGSNKLTTAVGAMTTTNFVTNQASSFVVNRADNTTQQSCVYTTDGLVSNSRFSNHIPWAGSVYFDIGDCCNDRINVGGLTGLNNYSVWSYDAINSATGKQLYRNGTLVQSVGVSTLSYYSHGSQRFNLGGFTGGTAGFQGDIAEVIIFRSKVNTAQRLIIQNYLSAKYNIALTANDLYTQDGSGYDHDVAGIGQVDNSNFHDDSRGTGIVRISSPGNLGDGEYFFWGHDNGALLPQTTDLPAGVQGRLTRVWSSQEIGNLNRVDVSFDLTGMGSVTAGDLRLLIDTDATFAAGATVVTGATLISGNLYRFNNVSEIVNDNGSNTIRFFTLGTSNIVQTPLPIILLSFNATVENDNDVKLSWKTAQETNNEFFTIERSSNGLDWAEVKTVPGKGNSNTLQSYSEFDENPLWGLSYYRLKQTDFDREFTYSRVVSVTVTKSFHDIEVFPIPATNEVFIQYPPAESIVIRLFDQMGREQVIFPMEGQQGATLDIADLSSGVYFIHLSNGKLNTYRKIVKE